MPSISFIFVPYFSARFFFLSIYALFITLFVLAHSVCVPHENGNSVYGFDQRRGAIEGKKIGVEMKKKKILKKRGEAKVQEKMYMETALSLRPVVIRNRWDTFYPRRHFWNKAVRGDQKHPLQVHSPWRSNGLSFGAHDAFINAHDPSTSQFIFFFFHFPAALIFLHLLGDESEWEREEKNSGAFPGVIVKGCQKSWPHEFSKPIHGLF